VTGDLLDHYRTALADTLLLPLVRGGDPGMFLGRLLHAGGSTALTSINDVIIGGLDAMLALAMSPWARANLYAPPAEVARLPEGARVTTPRFIADYVVTEWGTASLRGKSDAGRARDLCRVAHPAFREPLERGAATS